MSDNYDTSDDTSVKVAVRIRPQNSREIIDMCRICTSVESVEPQVILGADKAFTFDFVFDMNSNQNDIYNRCLENLVDGALNGYNATVLAYGQTGSGKTYTMGTGFERDICDEQIGIIPRAVYNLFSGIDNMKEQSKETMEFSLAIQFVELYNEEIIDLLDPYQKGKQYRIHEDLSGQITIADITVKSIYTPQDALKYLRQGALARSTASTQMNDQSSRSHALFTILIIRKQTESTQDSFIKDDIETFTSKFHFVDLAGSERLKRTGATGERAREGISINCGLLSLGNCISALGDKSKKSTHIPYRDSKLTRLLQDSLGGNSRTLMIACVSPSDRDFMETLNTLKYANRAKNIKNKVKLNQDKNSRTISQLRTEITTLQLELLEFKQGKRFVNHDGVSSHSDAFHENNMLIAENKRLQCRIKAMQETINMMSDANAKLKTERDVFKYYQEGHDFANVTDIISGYIKEIEMLQAKLRESEEMHKYLKQKTNFAYGDPSNTVVKYQSESLFLENDEQNSNPNNFTSANMPYLYEDSDGDSDDQNLSIHGDLYDINSDIEMKSKLLEQLETSQKRILLIRRHYEEKMSILQSTILNTQKERDEILSVIKKSNADEPSSQLKKIRGEYECKLNTLQNEVKKLQHGEREYIKQLRHAKTQEIKLRNLRNEINELKCIKARLARKISDQFKTHKNSEIKQSREILQLRKQHRKQENAVKTLQSQIMAKEQILKRKTEEVNALRKNQKCQKTSAQVIKKESKTYNSMIARQKLEKFRRGIARAARSKHVIQQLDRELDRLIAERDSLNFDLQNIRPCEKNDFFEMSNEEDTIKLSLNYVQENITYVQQSIIEIEDGKDSYSNETQFLHELISSIENMDEAKYLLKWLLDDAIVNKCNTIFSENLLTDQKTILNQMVQENLIQQQLIQHFLSQNNSMDICSIFDSINFKLSSISLNKLFQSQLSVNSNETYDIPFTDKLKSDLTEMHESIRGISPVQNSELVSKIRTRTAHAEDLLFGGHTSQKDGMTQSFQQDTLPNIGFPLTRVTSAPSALK